MANCQHCEAEIAIDEDGEVIFLFEGEPTITPCCKEAEEIVARSMDEELRENDDA